MLMVDWVFVDHRYTAKIYFYYESDGLKCGLDSESENFDIIKQ